MKRALFVLALATLTLCTLANQTHAQTIPLPYGTVEYIGHQGPNYAYACNTANGWYPLTTCIDATMHCDASLAVDDITFTFGYESPTAPYRGTIAVLSGAGGMTPATSTGHEIDAIKAYLADGFEIVQVQWDANWEAAKSFYIPDTFGNIQAAACRPAGFLQFVHSSTNPVLLQPGGGMCAHGLSAGSAAVVYALAWYGAGWGSTGYLDNVELLSGPVLSAVDLGCKVPVAPNVNVCSGTPGCKMAPGVQPWSLSPEYTDMPANSVRQWSNIASCANSSGIDDTFYLGFWNGMSILRSSITSQQLSYPSTSAKAWLCANVYQNEEAPNNSGPHKDGFFILPPGSASLAAGRLTR